MSKDSRIIILQGPPACGKSTKAKALLEQYGVDKAVIVCRDSIRESCESTGYLRVRIIYLIWNISPSRMHWLVI